MRTLATFALLAAAPAAAQAQTVNAIYSQNCAQCHMDDGRGGGAGAQSLIDLKREWLGGTTDRDLFNSIRDGLPDNGMPAYKGALSDAEIWGTVVWIRELQAQARRKVEGTRIPTTLKQPATTQHVALAVEDVVSGGLSVPWAVDWLPDGTMLITERPGSLRTFKDGKLSEPVKDTPAVRNRGQGGLMDVAVHPDYAKNGWVYLAFSDPLRREGARGVLGMTKVVRGKIKDGAWTDEQVIFRADDSAYQGTDLHFGCKIVFEPAKEPGKWYVFFGIGERGTMDRAQKLDLPNGKIHRVWDDGSIPDDNPFVKTEGALKTVWSWGHRNPQGLVRDLEGRLWDTEHGPRGGDELNLIEKGRNYGWPIVSFGINYQGTPFKQPFPDLIDPKDLPEGGIAMPAHVWIPSIGASGLDVVRGGPAGEAFPMWKGDLVAGGLSGANVDRVRIKDGKPVEVERIFSGHGRVRDVVCGPDGAVYVALNDPDKVIRIAPASGGPGAAPSKP